MQWTIICVILCHLSPELVAVCVLLFHIHEVIKCDEVWLVVHVENTSLDVIDVIAVVIYILGRSSSIGQDVIIVSDKILIIMLRGVGQNIVTTNL